jgi:hypothetical protein
MQLNEVKLYYLTYLSQRTTEMRMRVNGKLVNVDIHYCHEAHLETCLANRILALIRKFINLDQRSREFEDLRDEMFTLLLCTDERFWFRHAPPRNNYVVDNREDRMLHMHILRNALKAECDLDHEEIDETSGLYDPEDDVGNSPELVEWVNET